MALQTESSETQRLLTTNHSHQSHEDTAAGDTRTLLIASGLTTFFFLVELTGGYIAGSLAIMSDAAHLLSDLAGFVISLVAVSVSRLPPNEHLSFGFARAEVLGALVSILFIWALTIVLVFFAFHRLLNPSPVNGPLMLLLGIIGLVVNLSLGLVLGHGHSHAHGHSHGHGHSHEHSHSHAGYTDIENQVHSPTKVEEFPRRGHGQHENNNHDHNGSSHAQEHDDHDHDESQFNLSTIKRMLFADDSRSVNVRAAYLHVLGDALQNVGVIVAAIVITLRPTWSFIDPICTLLFAVIVIMTTAGLAKETLGVLMEGTPPSLNMAEISHQLISIPGVRKIGDLHIWSITPRIPALSVHLYREADATSHAILKEAQQMLDAKYGISHATIQVNCNTENCCDLPGQNGSNCVNTEMLQLPATGSN